MACIINTIEANLNFWGDHINRACTINAQPDYVNLFPAAGDAAWNLRGYDGQDQDLNIDRPSPEQCRLIERHIVRDITGEWLKIAGLIAGGIALSALVVCAFLVVAALVMIVFLELIAPLVELLMLIPNEAVGGALFELTIILGEASLLFAYMNLGAAALVALGTIWAKVVIPNVQRGFAYTHHLHDIARGLQFNGAA